MPLIVRRLGLIVIASLLGACKASPAPAPEPAMTGVVLEAPEDEDDPPGIGRARPAPPKVVTPVAPSKELKPPTPIPAPADVARPPRDAIRTSSGLTMKVLVAGAGQERPKVEDRVKVHYTGWAKSGAMFDSSVARGTPKIFRVDQIIKAFTEALPLMVTGEKRRLWVPSTLAYGDKPPVGVPAGDLVFDVELLEIFVEPKTPPVPEDVKAPPEGAVKTASGLAYRWLRKGTGTEHPNEKSRVMIQYSGFTPEGVMFDSSIPRGRPSTVSLSHVIPGLREGIALMAVGDQARLWIPAELAYTGEGGRGKGPLGAVVFDVELVSFQ